MSFLNLCKAASPPSIEDIHLKRQLGWILFLRVIVLTLLIGLTTLLETKEHQLILPPLEYVLYFIVGIYIYTILSALILNRIFCFRFFAYFQLITDVLLASCLVIYTQSSQSIFLTIYFYPIICGAILLFRRGSLLMAALSSLCYGGILAAEYHDLIDRLIPGFQSNIPTSQVAMQYFSTPGITFFLVAILASLLAERLYRAESELSQTSQSLDRLALLHKQIFDDINTGIITVASNGDITSFNKAAGQITGYNAVEVLGKNIETQFPELIEKKMEEGRPVASFTRKNGELIPVGYSWTRLNMPGDSANSKVYTMQDLSKIKSMEDKMRQAEKMAAIGEMAAGVAHEFRNPLAAISGAAQVLQGDIINDPDSSGLLTIITRECDRLDGTIRDFLQFSKPADPEKNWFSLQALIQESCELLAQSAKWDNNIEIIIDLPENLDCWGDSGQIKQVIINLITNARNAIGAKDGTITISAIEQNADNMENTVIRITDTGPGIEERILQTIFEPFFTTRENGTGLGLAIVKQLINSHDGTVTAVNNTDGTGATFTFTLPLP
ncbi:MAG: PAS domain S-box protein [Desulfobulbaceae bacterium]|uniref:histidine kinase n=1 Tax=Candidatus Desulfobia pelagia TaxID=2841692 RepID=A0A8J6TGU1_9BACT|nr:PAS domain S-box protein [Candidatus Desulfobia pelagia]